MKETTWRELAALALAAGLATACNDGESADSGDQGASLDPIDHALGLTHSERVRPHIVEGDDGVLTVSITIDDREHELVLEPVSVRTSGFQLFVQAEDGSLSQVAAPPISSVRGTVTGIPDSIVTGSMMEDGLHARIALSPHDVYWTEPVARVTELGSSDEYALYRDSDVMDLPKTCGLDHVVQHEFEDLGAIALQTGEAEGLAVAELAVDADYEFYEAWGSVDNAVARMEAVVSAINVQYEAEVGIQHVLSAAVVRTTPEDPYSSTDALTMLQDELRPEWLNNHGDIQRDTVHLFTGKDIDGYTIGIAYVGAVCTSYGFGVSQSNFSSNFACVTDLTAHELGHNWAAQHCSCPGNTMNPSLTCANTFSAADTVPSIENHRDTRTCLSFGDGCPDDPDKTEPGICGCGVPDTDSDLDGTADCEDGCPDDENKTEPGECGCGVLDEHSDGDGVADCNDGCPDDSNKLEPGECGCGIADTDSDGDGVADCNDGCPDDAGATDPADCPETFCGDGTCDADEDCSTCATDCGACPPVCGDGVCEEGEDCSSCASDCGTCPPTCGNAACEEGEDCSSCPDDCGTCPPVCGDAVCDSGEDCSTCPSDCGTCPPACGDGTCDSGESQCSCPSDCGAAPTAELSCSDGLDDDCDLLVDCDDPDCDADQACASSCEADGTSCTSDADCCSQKCRGPDGRKTCHSSDKGGGGGSDNCGQPGDACNGNGECCSKECDKSEGICREPGGDALSLGAPVPEDEAPRAETGSKLVGGCSASGGGGDAALLAILLCCAVRLRRGRRDRTAMRS